MTLTQSILTVLKNDLELELLLKPTATNSKIHMFSTKEGIAYKLIPLTSDGIKGQYRLEITVVHKDYDVAMSILDRVKKLLITFSDTPFNNKIKSIGQTGGGIIENPDTKDINLTCLFILRVKEI